jgi:hypothetical protein
LGLHLFSLTVVKKYPTVELEPCYKLQFFFTKEAYQLVVVACPVNNYSPMSISGFSESGFVSPENILHPAIFFPARMLASYLPLHNSTARAGNCS